MISTVFVSVRSVDDGSQARWSDYLVDVHSCTQSASERVHGAWVSGPTEPWRGACWALEVAPGRRPALREALARLATRHEQAAVVWAEATVGTLSPMGDMDTMVERAAVPG